MKKSAKTNDELIVCKNLSKIYGKGETLVTALDSVSFSLSRSTFTAILGPSGSGKSTLMNILGCLDSPSSGEYFLEGKEVSSLSNQEACRIRNQKIGFIFQNFNLLARYNIYHNIELPLLYSEIPPKKRHDQVCEAIEAVGLEKRIKHKPGELSGGQRQRVAIARALVTRPSIIFADEPTGNLDSKTGESIITLFRDLIKSGNTIVMVTHDLHVANEAQGHIVIEDGKILTQKKKKHKSS